MKTPSENLFTSVREERTLTVSELTRAVSSVLGAEFVSVKVEGEISGFRPHPNGHRYFTLKDATSQISCVMWKSRPVRFELKDGIAVIASGNVTLYQVRGQLQLDVASLSLRGKGTLFEQFEALKRKLEEEGLFEHARKRPIPRMVRTLGVVSSLGGAVIHDIINVTRRRWPSLHIIIRDVRVQGEGAAEDIARAIEEFNAYKNIDIMIVGRGGGSLEDLWAFNEEIVARAIYNSLIPVVSAVGHETDFSIADFVADVRAATPSQAGEFVTPNRFEIAARLGNLLQSAHASVQGMINERVKIVNHFTSSYSFNRPQDLVRERIQRLDELSLRMKGAIVNLSRTREERLGFLARNLRALTPETTLSAARARHSELETRLERATTTAFRFHEKHLSSIEIQLNALGPQNVLSRGYAIVRDAQGAVRSRGSQLASGEDVTIQFTDASREARMK